MHTNKNSKFGWKFDDRALFRNVSFINLLKDLTG